MILETVESAKYLGITISKDLRWHNHICAVAKKCNSTLHFISRNLHDCSRNSRSLAYTTLVRPKLEYCATVWDPHTKKDCDTLEKINHRAARIVFKKPWCEPHTPFEETWVENAWREMQGPTPHHALQNWQRPCRNPTHSPPRTWEKTPRALQEISDNQDILWHCQVFLLPSHHQAVEPPYLDWFAFARHISQFSCGHGYNIFLGARKGQVSGT